MTELEKKLINANKIIAPKTWDYTYGNMVRNNVRKKYSADDMEAIINNYLDDPTNPEYLQEFKNMQIYRKECKLKVKAEMN
jgi:hypothetical protein